METSSKKVLICFVLTLMLMGVFSCKKRCPIDSCQTKMQHAHGGSSVFRGMPWWKKQNPRTGEMDPVLNRDGNKY